MSANRKACGSGLDDQHALQDAEIKDRLKRIANKILVMSGKGGVGKSSVAAYLALALAKKGRRVGLMDVDLHGPSIPRMLGLKGGVRPSPNPGKAMPVELMPNLHVVSIESLMGENRDAATIWRGPLKIGVIRQFISDMEWPELDYLIVDSPPGTGDEPLTVAQTIPDAKALIVTTPQEVSLADVRKSINFCRQVHLEILGLLENMSGLTCPHCGREIGLFKTEGGRKTAEKEGLRFLGKLPIEPQVVRWGDEGDLSGPENDGTAFALEFKKMVALIEDLGSRKTDSTALAENRSEPNLKEKHKENSMEEKVVFAVPTSGGKLCSHFGHCDEFALIETESGQIKSKAMITPPPHEPGVLPRWLHEQGAKVIIAGGMGARAQQLFGENGIRVVTGAPSDSPETLVDQYMSGALITGDNTCDH